MAEKAAERKSTEGDASSRESSPEKDVGRLRSRGHTAQSLESLELVASDSSEEALSEETQANGEDVGANVTEAQPQRRHRERKISITMDKVSDLKMEVIKEGYLLHQGRTFQKWAKRYLTVTGDRLFIAKSKEDKLSEEIVLKDVTVAENSNKNVNHSFTVLTPFQQVALAACSRKDMEEWISAFKVASSKSKQASMLETLQHLEGQHSWFACTHARPTYCNICRETLHGVAWHGLSCEVCKFKSHRRCVFQVKKPCKWTTQSSLKKDCVLLQPDFSIPHQWVEGNLPAGSKCAMCERACGSVRRLQDFRCIWCKWTVHSECLDKVNKTCTLGEHCLSVLPPSALQRSDAIRKGMWEPYKVNGRNPVLAMVNSKSGENLGVKFLRKLKFWLNPAQVFDLAISGPELGLQLFQRFEKFRIIVFGGDGSIGWVLSAVDKYNLHSKCMVGVVPLGTGNDLARVMGWGSQCNDEEKIPTLLTDMEQSSFKLLDRWSLQFTTESDVDLTPLRASSPTKSDQGRSSVSVSETALGAKVHLGAPFPGPTSRSLSSPGGLGVGLLSPDSVFSHQDSSSTSDCEYRSTYSQTPSPDCRDESSCQNGTSRTDIPDDRALRQNGVNGSGDPDLESSDELCMLVPSEGKNGVSAVTSNKGGSQEAVKINSMATHLSTILLSEDVTAVISSSQVLCQMLKDFLTSVLASKEHQLPLSDFINDPLVQQCSVLQEKLQGVIGNLKSEAVASTEPQQTGVGSGKKGRTFQAREALMLRANSLKKALRGVIDMTEEALDAQAQTTVEMQAITRNILPDHQDRDGSSSPDSSHSFGSEMEPGRTSPPPKRKPSESTSSHGSVVDPVPVLPETREVACMNNYFGLGLDAQIAYQFNATREKNPAQYKSRTKNKVLYGIIGGKEFFVNSQRYLERRIHLECDGKVMTLPQKLQGLVFLNIPSYMAGTNFWGTEKEKHKQGFCAPSHDDKLMEVVGITGFTHIATAKVLGIQNQRIAQCRYAKITLLGPEKHPVQVDGEAWLQDPGTLILSHKNKARMLVRDKAFTQSLESWKQKATTSQSASANLPALTINTSTLAEVLSEEELQRFREVAVAVRPLLACIKFEASVNSDVARGLVPHISTAAGSLERVFPDNHISETADMEHLQDFERDVKALLQEALWYLNMKKISPDNEEAMRNCVHGVEAQMRRLISTNLSTASQAHHGFRRASDSLIAVRPPQKFVKHSPMLPAHRERAAQLVPDTTISAANIAKKIGKEVLQWNTQDVCQWFEELGLEEYQESIHTHEITGKELLDLHRSDLMDLGIKKVGHLTRLRQALQALAGGSPALTRASQSRESVK